MKNIIISILVILIFTFKPFLQIRKSYYKQKNLKNQISLYEEKTKKINEQIVRYDISIKKLEEDFEQEKIARNKLKMVKENEVIYKLIKNQEED